MVGFPQSEIDKDTPIVKLIQEYDIGGVILFDRFFQDKKKIKNIQSPAQVQNLTKTLKTYSTDLLIAVDQEGGKVQRLKSRDGFRSTKSAKAIAQMTKEKAKVEYEKLSLMLKELGINCNLAPVVDMEINKDNFVIKGLERSYGKSSLDVAQFASIFIDSMNSHGILSTIKHFPGHGSSLGDTHKGFVDVSSTWQEKELEPYKTLISQKKVKMIMTAHIFNKHLDQKYPATLSHKINTKLLREKLGFDGVIISDDLQMKAISDHYSLKETVTLAINAGVDMLLFGNQLSTTDTKKIIETIFEQVKTGEIKYADILNSNQRIDKIRL